MKIPLVDLVTGFKEFEHEIFEALKAVFEKMNLYLGPNVTALEEEFASYCGARYAVAVGSGTDAIMIALLACGIKPGDEVITSPHTFYATAEAIVNSGAVPVFADIEEESYNINPAQIEKKITEKTRAIIPVHMYGQSATMDSIINIANRYNLKIIEDACQAHGAEYRGKKCGNMGDAGCFSFYYTKNLGAYGEGGIIITNNYDVAERAKQYRNHGHISKYEHEVIGYNSRLDEIQAAILRLKLKRLDLLNEKRRKIASLYNDLLKETPLILPEELENRKHVYHLYVIRAENRDELQKYLEKYGIATGIHYKNPVHLQKYFRERGYKEGDFPVTEKICKEILSLPMYPELKEEQIYYIVSKIKEFYGI